MTAKHGSRDFALGHSACLQKAPSAKLKLLPPLQVLQDAGKNKGQAPVNDVTKHGIFKVGTAGRSTMAAGILATELEKLTLCCPILAVTSCMAFGTMCALPMLSVSCTVCDGSSHVCQPQQRMLACSVQPL